MVQNSRVSERKPSGVVLATSFNAVDVAVRVHSGRRHERDGESNERQGSEHRDRSSGGGDRKDRRRSGGTTDWSGRDRERKGGGGEGTEDG